MSRPSSASSGSSSSSVSTYTREAGRFRRSGMWNWNTVEGQQHRPSTTMQQWGRSGRPSPRLSASGIRLTAADRSQRPSTSMGLHLHPNNHNNNHNTISSLSTSPEEEDDNEKEMLPVNSSRLLQTSLGISRNEIPLFPENAKEGTKEYLKEMMADEVDRDSVMSPFVDGETHRRQVRHRLRLAQKMAQTKTNLDHRPKSNGEKLESFEELDKIFLHRWHFGKPGQHYEQFHKKHHRHHGHHGHHGHHEHHAHHDQKQDGGQHGQQQQGQHQQHQQHGQHGQHEQPDGRGHLTPANQEIDRRREKRQTLVLDGSLTIEFGGQYMPEEHSKEAEIHHTSQHGAGGNPPPLHPHHHHHHRHRHHHHGHPDHGHHHPLHLHLHPYHKHRDSDHVNEWLDNNRNRSASPVFLRQNLSKIDHHASFGHHIIANEKHSNRRREHALGASERVRSDNEHEQISIRSSSPKGSKGKNGSPLGRGSRAGSPIDDGGFSSVSSDTDEDDKEVDEAEVGEDGDGDAEVSSIMGGNRRNSSHQKKMTSSQKVHREQMLHIKVEGHDANIDENVKQTAGKHHAHHFVTARERMKKREVAKKVKRSQDKKIFFSEYQSRTAHRHKLTKDPVTPSHQRNENATKKLPISPLRKSKLIQVTKETVQEQKKRMMKMSVSAAAAAAAREALQTMRECTNAPSQSEMVRMLHALQLYTPNSSYLASLNPESRLFSAEKVQRKRQMTIDLYLDTCEKLGIVPEPLIIGVLEQGNGSSSGIISGSEEQTLRLANMSLGNRAIVALCTALGHEDCHAEYTSMHLEKNRISGGVGAQAISRMVESHGLCRLLHLSGNDLRTHGSIEIGKSLSNKRSNLLHLDLGDNNIGRDGVIALCAGLVGNQSLLSLNLSRNSLTHTSAPILSSMLRENTTLQVLNLSWNGLAGQGAVELFRALRRRPAPAAPKKRKKKKKNTKRKKTDNGSLIIDIEEGAPKEAKWNTSLRSIDLSWCGLGNKSMPVAREAVDTLRMCSFGTRNAASLTHVNLSNNGLTTSACVSIVAALSNVIGGSMRALHLNGNDPSPPLSRQAVESTHQMHPNQSFPSHRLPARSVQRVLKECAGNALEELKYGKGGKKRGKGGSKGGKGGSGKKASSNNNTKKKQGGTKKKKKDGMLGSIYLGIENDGDKNIYTATPPTPKEILKFLKTIKTEEEDMPDGYSWIFARYSGCTGVANRDVWRECSVCWICKGHRPCRFHYSPGLSGAAGINIGLQLDFKHWRPLKMSTSSANASGRRMSFVSPASMVVMVPPGRSQYTFLVTHPHHEIHGKMVEEEVYAMDQLSETSKRRAISVGHSFEFLRKDNDSMSRSSSMSSWNSNLSESSSSSSSSDDGDNGGESSEEDESGISIHQSLKLNIIDSHSYLQLVNYVDIPLSTMGSMSGIPYMTPDDRIDGKDTAFQYDDHDNHDMEVWCRSRSIFRTFRQETVNSLMSEFNIHWKYVRIKRLVSQLSIPGTSFKFSFWSISLSFFQFSHIF